MKCQDCTFLGQIPVSNMLNAGVNILERVKISSKWEGFFVCFLFSFSYYQDSSEGRIWVESIVSGLEALRALEAQMADIILFTDSPGQYWASTGGTYRPEETWWFLWGTQDFPGLEGKVEFTLNFSQLRPSPESKLMLSHTEHLSMTPVCRNLPSL